MEGKKLVIVLAQESKHIVSSCWGKVELGVACCQQKVHDEV